MDKTGEQIAHEKALYGLFQQMIDGWNQGNGQAYAAPFTEDADYVIVDGKQVKGREVIAFGHQYIFNTVFKGSRMQGQVKDIRFLSADIALMHAEGVLQMPGQAGSVSEQPSTMTIVAIRQTERWGFTAFHNTRLEERPQ
ncbi:MAG TPA: SgcJ/EcaC family oxidoreductase [Ktedonobacteraceae bacterium]|nr:SgcJ/EcaC family oxidoreductase [Ktedonobacteraceae bacterium]